MAKAAYSDGPSKAEMDRYQAEDDLRTLAEAQRIKSDKKRMGAAMKCAKDKLAAVKEMKK